MSSLTLESTLAKDGETEVGYHLNPLCVRQVAETISKAGAHFRSSH
ncbi:MAG: hypothetical protein ABI210_04220 [Abditibacteriaceae bacterium]